MELFSVIVANYNNGKYLPELIESVKSQTYTSWELIISDDKSTDDSLEIIEPYLSDRRIKLIRHKTNMGAAAAFRSACEAATGIYVGMLGADDALLPGAIESVVSVHQKYTEASLVYTNYFQCDETLKIIRIGEISKEPIPGKLIYNFFVSNFATFKKSKYTETEGFNPFFKRALDQDIFLKLDEVGDIVYLPEPLYLYRSNLNGISQGTNGILATQYHIQAVVHAYYRRKKSGYNNISYREYRELLVEYCMKEIHINYKKKKYINTFARLVQLTTFNIKYLRYFMPRYFAQIINYKFGAMPFASGR